MELEPPKDFKELFASLNANSVGYFISCRSWSIYLFALLLFLTAGAPACSVKEPKSNLTTPTPQPPAPTATVSIPAEEIVTPSRIGVKDQIFYDDVDKAVIKIGERHLRNTELKPDDVEIRVWQGFGITTLNGFVLRRSANVWHAYFVDADFNQNKDLTYTKKPIEKPANSWNSAWHLLLQQGILTIQDSFSLNCSANLEDGHSYFIEVRKGSNYRSYFFDNPDHKTDSRCPEARKVVNIGKIIDSEYGNIRQ